MPEYTCRVSARTGLSPRSSWNSLRREYTGNSDTKAVYVPCWRLST
jgi:hypothetical protein